MIKKPSGCSGCPLEHKGQGYCPDNMTKRPRFLFIGEAPGKNEIGGDKPQPFVGKAGFVLKQWLMRAVPDIQLAEEKKEISYANTLRCLPPEIQGRPYPKGEEKELAETHCRQYNQFPESLETIVLFGDSPQRVWFKSELNDEDASDRRLGRDVKGVTGRIGRTYTKDNKIWVFAPHPAYILRQPAMVAHGQQALRIASGSEKVIEPDYIKWHDAIKILYEM